jgi:hypothetical protein
LAPGWSGVSMASSRQSGIGLAGVLAGIVDSVRELAEQSCREVELQIQSLARAFAELGWTELALPANKASGEAVLADLHGCSAQLAGLDQLLRSLETASDDDQANALHGAIARSLVDVRASLARVRQGFTLLAVEIASGAEGISRAGDLPWAGSSTTRTEQMTGSLGRSHAGLPCATDDAVRDIIIAMQFYDRMSQRAEAVDSILDRLDLFLSAVPVECSDEACARLSASLIDVVALSAVRGLFERNLRRRTGHESLPPVQDGPDIELF